jgi:hypothetical protein
MVVTCNFDINCVENCYEFFRIMVNSQELPSILSPIEPSAHEAGSITERSRSLAHAR